MTLLRRQAARRNCRFRWACALARAAGVTGAVRISLLSTQPMPKKTIKENNQDKSVDDVDKALRLESDVHDRGRSERGHRQAAAC